MKTSYSFPPIQRRSSHSALLLFSFFAAVVVLAMAGGIVQADPGGGPPPVVVDSIEPAEIVQGQVPSPPEIQVFGSNFIEGLPSKTNRPTVTLRHVDDLAEFSALAFVNFAGTVATVPPLTWNFLQAPLGAYDVIVTRPTDKASATLKGAFAVTDGQPNDGEIGLVVQSAWGGPVNDVAIVGNLAYAAIGRRLVILDLADEANPIEIGSLYIPSGVAGVAVSGDYAFLAATGPYRFCVVDVSDPTDPTLVSAGQGSQSHPREVYLRSGGLAYVFSGSGGGSGNIEVFDVSNPLSVVAQGSLVSVGSGRAMAISGDLLYVGGGRFFETAECNPPQEMAAVELRIYDLAADPLNPPLLGSVLTDCGDGEPGLVNGGNTIALSVEGNYAVWAIRDKFSGTPDTTSFRVVDVSDPQLPVIVGSYDNGPIFVGHQLGDVALSGGYAYVTDGAIDPAVSIGPPTNWAFAEGLIVFDIATDPTNPTIVSTFKTHGDVAGVQIVGNRAYLHDSGEGLIILDISNPAKPVRLGNYYSPAVLRRMVKAGDLLYVTDAWNGFTVLDVSDAAHPQVVGVYLADHYNDRGVNALGLVLRDNLVYLAAGHLGLEVVDVSDPSNPTFLAAYRITPPFLAESRFAGLAMSGDVAHVGFARAIFGSCGSSLLNLDLSNLPNSITQLGEVPIGYCTPLLTIELNDQSIAFVARDYGIGSDNYTDLTIDTSDPANPTVIYDGVVPAVADVALDVDRKILYLAGDEDRGVNPEPGLFIQDVTDPANPVLLTHVDENYPLGDGIEQLAHAFAVALQGQRAYVIGLGCSSNCGIEATYLFDVADPTAPVFLDVMPYAGGTRSSVLVEEPIVYVSNEKMGGSQTGLVILRVEGLNPVGDLDGDGTVGVKDLLILLGDWGPCDDCTDCPADLDGDCTVGVKDLLILLGNWG